MITTILGLVRNRPAVKKAAGAVAGFLALCVVALTLTRGSTRMYILAVMMIAVVGALLWQAFNWWRFRKKKTAIEEDSDQTGLTKKLVDDLNKGLEKFRGSLHEFPWYVVVGPPGSGKTQMMAKSTIADERDVFQAKDGGTQGMNWWPTAGGIFLDLAGKVFESDSRWPQFIEWLAKQRPNEPFHGVLLVVPATDLLEAESDSGEAPPPPSAGAPAAVPQTFFERAAAIQGKLAELRDKLDVRFPVWVIVTKADLIPGFRAFFNDITEFRLQHQMLGWSAPRDLDHQSKQEALDEAMDTIIARLRRQRMLRLNSLVRKRDRRAMGSEAGASGGPRQTDEAEPLFTLVDELVRITPRLKHYLRAIFTPRAGPRGIMQPPFLRGIYFASSEQSGTALSDQMRRLGIRVTEPSILNKAMFEADIFRERVFRERGLVTRDSNVQKGKKRKWVIRTSVGSAAALLFLGFTVWQFYSFRGSIGNHVTHFEPIAAAAKIEPLDFLVASDAGKLRYHSVHGAGPVTSATLTKESYLTDPALSEFEDSNLISIPRLFRPLNLLLSRDLETKAYEVHQRLVQHVWLDPLIDESLAYLAEASNWTAPNPADPPDSGDPIAATDAFATNTRALKGLLALVSLSEGDDSFPPAYGPRSEMSSGGLIGTPDRLARDILAIAGLEEGSELPHISQSLLEDYLQGKDSRGQARPNLWAPTGQRGKLMGKALEHWKVALEHRVSGDGPRLRDFATAAEKYEGLAVDLETFEKTAMDKMAGVTTSKGYTNFTTWYDTELTSLRDRGQHLIADLDRLVGPGRARSLAEALEDVTRQLKQSDLDTYLQQLLGALPAAPVAEPGAIEPSLSVNGVDLTAAYRQQIEGSYNSLSATLQSTHETLSGQLAHPGLQLSLLPPATPSKFGFEDRLARLSEGLDSLKLAQDAFTLGEDGPVWAKSETDIAAAIDGISSDPHFEKPPKPGESGSTDGDRVRASARVLAQRFARTGVISQYLKGQPTDVAGVRGAVRASLDDKATAKGWAVVPTSAQFEGVPFKNPSFASMLENARDYHPDAMQALLDEWDKAQAQVPTDSARSEGQEPPPSGLLDAAEIVSSRDRVRVAITDYMKGARKFYEEEMCSALEPKVPPIDRIDDPSDLWTSRYASVLGNARFDDTVRLKDIQAWRVRGMAVVRGYLGKQSPDSAAPDGCRFGEAELGKWNDPILTQRRKEWWENYAGQSLQALHDRAANLQATEDALFDLSSDSPYWSDLSLSLMQRAAELWKHERSARLQRELEKCGSVFPLASDASGEVEVSDMEERHRELAIMRGIAATNDPRKAVPLKGAWASAFEQLRATGATMGDLAMPGSILDRGIQVCEFVRGQTEPRGPTRTLAFRVRYLADANAHEWLRFELPDGSKEPFSGRFDRDEAWSLKLNESVRIWKAESQGAKEDEYVEVGTFSGGQVFRLWIQSESGITIHGLRFEAKPPDNWPSRPVPWPTSSDWNLAESP